MHPALLLRGKSLFATTLSFTQHFRPMQASFLLSLKARTHEQVSCTLLCNPFLFLHNCQKQERPAWWEAATVGVLIADVSALVPTMTPLFNT